MATLRFIRHRRSLRRHGVVAVALLAIAGAAIHAQSPQRPPSDVSPPSDISFQATDVSRQKLTTTNVLITVLARVGVPQLDLTVGGTSLDLHHAEMKPDTVTTSLSGLAQGQQPQVTGRIVSSPGQAGLLTIAARTTNPGFNVESVLTEIPFQNRNGQLKFAEAKPGLASAPVGISAKTGTYTTSDGYVVSGEVRVRMKGFSSTPADATVNVTAEGVTLLAKGETKPSGDSGAQFARTITFAAVDGQKGRIITELSGKNADGAPYSRRSYVYVLADSRKLYTSTSGFVDLDVQKLKADLEAHVINLEQYNRRLLAVLSGATESGVIKQ